MQMMNREIIPSRKQRGFDGVLYLYIRDSCIIILKFKIDYRLNSKTLTLFRTFSSVSRMINWDS